MLTISMFFKGFNGVLNYFDKWAITFQSIYSRCVVLLLPCQDTPLLYRVHPLPCQDTPSPCRVHLLPCQDTHLRCRVHLLPCQDTPSRCRIHPFMSQHSQEVMIQLINNQLYNFLISKRFKY